jgi:hypothetical protein
MLTTDAYPSVFSNLPSYLSEAPFIKRKEPSSRFNNDENENPLTQDKINNLEDILLKIEAGEICLVDWVTKKKKIPFNF